MDIMKTVDVTYYEMVQRMVMVDVPVDLIPMIDGEPDLEDSEVRNYIFEHVAMRGWDDEFVEDTEMELTK